MTVPSTRARLATNDVPHERQNPSPGLLKGTRKHQTMQASRRADARCERVRLAERQAKGDGPAFLAEQRRLVTDGKEGCERNGRRRRQLDLSTGRRFVPPGENQASQVCRIRVLPRGCYPKTRRPRSSPTRKSTIAATRST